MTAEDDKGLRAGFTSLCAFCGKRASAVSGKKCKG